MRLQITYIKGLLLWEESLFGRMGLTKMIRIIILMIREAVTKCFLWKMK